MLIDLSIVILVSILYYLICSLSRIINLIGGMLLIFLLCWAVGVNVKYDTCIAELGFLVIAVIINVWIALRSHHLVNSSSDSRMNKFHHHHSDHVYAIRNRLNNFRLKSIGNHFRATPQVYLRTVSHQLNQLNRYVRQHSNYLQTDQLMKSLQVIQAEIDDINYHLDLPMQVNFPHGLKRLLRQYRRIIRGYHVERQMMHQENVITDVLSHGAKKPAKQNVFLHVNLQFPYQRLINDRITRQIDLLAINPRGVFAFTLLSPRSNRLNVNRNDEILTQDINSKRYPDFQTTVNLKRKLNHDFNALDYLIPNQISVLPHVGMICTNPNVKVHLADPKFKVIKPQQLDILMARLPPVLTSGQVHRIAVTFRDCFARNKKYQWPVFNSATKSTLSKLLRYQDQVKTLDHKLSY